MSNYYNEVIFKIKELIEDNNITQAKSLLDEELKMPYIPKKYEEELNNNDFEASMKTAIKKVEKAVKANDKEEAKKALADAIKKIDKANAKGVVKDNFKARNKCRLTKKVNEME